MNIRKIQTRTTNRGQSAYTVAEAMIGVCVLALMLVALLAGMTKDASVFDQQRPKGESRL